MNASSWPAFVLLALAVCSACGESTSDDDDGDTDGSKCATDADCSGEAPKCVESGRCLTENGCEVDADCRGDAKHCNAFHTCDLCAVDADCPSEAPVCAPSWEAGLYCAECRGGDSSTCPSGTWCTPQIGETGGGRCEPANCAAVPEGNPCLACINENAAACLDEGGDCEGTHAELDLCYSMELAGSGTCPSGIVPAIRGCTPEACFDEAEAFEACLIACDAVTAICGA